MPTGRAWGKIIAVRIVDLSHEISAGMITYPGLPGPEIEDHLSFEASHGVYAAGTEFCIGRISMVTNTGTYLDTPAHRYRSGHDLSGLALERCVDLPVVVVAVHEVAIGPAELPDEIEDGCAVLLHSGWDRHWGTGRYGDPVHPHLTEEGARHLVEQHVGLVGIDSVNIDDTVGGARPAHSVLLEAGVPIVEHLTALDGLPERGARFSAVPPAVRGLATFPVRAFATIA